MTYCQDLTPCTYGHHSELPPHVAVGWLEPPFEFPRGPVKRAIRDRLEALFRGRWSYLHTFGSHACRFCVQAAGISSPTLADRGMGDLPRGSTNILIPGRDVAYVVPELIVHYIDEHRYCPPSAFARAVTVCPPAGSRRYFLALMALGGEMPDLVEYEASYSAAARHAVLLWRNPLMRAWCRRVRSRATGPRLLSEPLLEEWAAMRRAREVREFPFPRQRVVDFLLRVSNAGHAVQEQGDDFVLPHPDGEIRVCPSDVRWVVRRKGGKRLVSSWRRSERGRVGAVSVFGAR